MRTPFSFGMAMISPIRWCRSIDLRDKWRRALVKHRPDSRQRTDEVAGEFCRGHLPDHDEKRNLEALHRRQLVRNIANSTVVRNRHPATPSAVLQPLLIAAIGREEVGVSLDRYACISQDLRKLLSEVAIREVDPAHAARE